MMLRHLGESQAAERIEVAVREVIKGGKSVTRDLNPTRYVSTQEMTEAIIAKLQE